MQTNDKLREALERILSVCADAEVTDCQAREIAEDVAGAALAEPPRNCDVGSEQEQSQRFDKFCFTNRTYEWGCSDCPLLKSVCCELAWAQMPYREGGNK